MDEGEARNRERRDAVIDLLASLAFLAGSVLFFWEATTVVGTALFVVGSALFVLRPAMTLLGDRGDTAAR